MALTFQAKALISGTHTKTFEGQSPSNTLTFTYTKNWVDGTAVDQSDLIWIDKDRNLNATTEEIDLSGSLTDAFGDTVAFNFVTGMYIWNKNTTATETLKVGGSATNAFPLFDNSTDIYEIGPDGVFFVNEPSLAAKNVTAGTGDLLKLDAGAANITFDIAIWGRT